MHPFTEIQAQTLVNLLNLAHTWVPADAMAGQATISHAAAILVAHGIAEPTHLGIRANKWKRKER